MCMPYQVSLTLREDDSHRQWTCQRQRDICPTAWPEHRRCWRYGRTPSADCAETKWICCLSDAGLNTHTQTHTCHLTVPLIYFFKTLVCYQLFSYITLHNITLQNSNGIVSQYMDITESTTFALTATNRDDKCRCSAAQSINVLHTHSSQSLPWSAAFDRDQITGNTWRSRRFKPHHNHLH